MFNETEQCMDNVCKITKFICVVLYASYLMHIQIMENQQVFGPKKYLGKVKYCLLLNVLYYVKCQSNYCDICKNN